MKQISDYILYNSWQLDELNIKPDEEYFVIKDFCDLKRGGKFVRFDDVDNHYGIFVFLDTNNNVLAVAGDCSGKNHSCITNLKSALSKI